VPVCEWITLKRLTMNGEGDHDPSFTSSHSSWSPRWELVYRSCRARRRGPLIQEHHAMPGANAPWFEQEAAGAHRLRQGNIPATGAPVTAGFATDPLIGPGWGDRQPALVGQNPAPFPCLGPFSASAHAAIIPARAAGIGKVQAAGSGRPCWSPRTSTSPARREPAATPLAAPEFKGHRIVAIQVEGMVLQGPAARSGPLDSVSQSAAAAGRQLGSRAQDSPGVDCEHAPPLVPSIIPCRS